MKPVSPKWEHIFAWLALGFEVEIDKAYAGRECALRRHLVPKCRDIGLCLSVHHRDRRSTFALSLRQPIQSRKRGFWREVFEGVITASEPQTIQATIPLLKSGWATSSKYFPDDCAFHVTALSNGTTVLPLPADFAVQDAISRIREEGGVVALIGRPASTVRAHLAVAGASDIIVDTSAGDPWLRAA